LDKTDIAIMAARVAMMNEDVVRKILSSCGAVSLGLFSGTCRANRLLAREETLWEELFVRSGLRFRPPHWAAHAAEGAEDELEPDSWRLAFQNHLLFAFTPWQSLPAHLGHGILGPRGRLLRVHSAGLDLQQALALADNGDIIELAPGIYKEHVTLSKEVWLIGVNRDCVEIFGSVFVEADNVTITIASLRIIGHALEIGAGAEEGEIADMPAVRVAAGTLQIFDCDIRGAKGIEVEKGFCNVSKCDIQVQDSCFEGVGHLDSCRLQVNSNVIVLQKKGAFHNDEDFFFACTVVMMFAYDSLVYSMTNCFDDSVSGT
jgi:hypothetical protein